MWLTCSTVGRKFIMAVSGAVLVLFLTFHCCMNSIAICWPAAYNSLCEFLGANWYALIASAGLALFILLHIVYACWLTLQNRKARGPVRYEMSKKPKTVEWSSKNMLVLGVVVLAFLVVHLIQFWAKMQLQEIRGVDEVLPPAAGTLFLQEAFQTNWTWIVYIIGFIALWFHLNHGIWSMFQSVGWDNTVWIARLKKVAICWSSVVCLLFVAQAIVFTAKAHDDYFKKDPTLREQYKAMIVPMLEKDFGPDAANLSSLPFEDFSNGINQMLGQLNQLPDDISDPQIINQLTYISNPEEKEMFLKQIQRLIDGREKVRNAKKLIDYLNGVDPNQETASVQTLPGIMPEAQAPGAPGMDDQVIMEEQESIEEFAGPAQPEAEGNQEPQSTNNQ